MQPLAIAVSYRDQLEPQLFASYISPVSRVIDAFVIRTHAYAYDITLYLELRSDPDAPDII